jgi:hypothetical protein
MLGVNFSDNKIFFLYFNLLSNSISPFKIELIKRLRQNYHEFYKHIMFLMSTKFTGCKSSKKMYHNECILLS